MTKRRKPEPALTHVAGIEAVGERVSDARGWPRTIVSDEVWRAITERVADGSWTMLGLWGDVDEIHMAVWEEPATRGAIATVKCEGGSFPSVGALHPPAIRLERAIRDLFGLEPDGTPDARPWLDHGRWGVRFPMSKAPQPAVEGAGYAFLPVEGEDLHQIGVGPVHAGVIEPGHFRFTAAGETIVRLEERLGYTHKGVQELMRGAELGHAALLAGRVSGDSTVAYSLAFARAVETALETSPPERAIWLRALMAELERLANHLGDIGAVCNDASFALMHAHCGVLREQVLRAAELAFGHRLMRDRVIPGGVAVDLPPAGETAIRGLVEEIRRRFPKLVGLYDDTASLQDRTVGAGKLEPALARQFAAGGFIGRASGRRFDARQAPGYAPYDGLRFDIPVRDDGDVNARVWIRIREIEQSLSLVEQVLAGLPDGPVTREVPAPNSPREGSALVEGFRGDILAWVRISGGSTVEQCHLRDPSWFQWPLLEVAIEDNIVADFPLCNKSFNCSYSGQDL